ncbi:unnamed protein product [Prorocentrum cordatum]|uniref:Uncharacterized protein n=1 Tax=Prorocentrum cordatum TaxID=2364126 RepID=A0ABN9T2B5_9DINO|nr:unnamed protein product [Polarella glacialis]
MHWKPTDGLAGRPVALGTSTGPWAFGGRGPSGGARDVWARAPGASCPSLRAAPAERGAAGLCSAMAQARPAPERCALAPGEARPGPSATPSAAAGGLGEDSAAPMLYRASMPPNSKDCLTKCYSVRTFLEAYTAASELQGGPSGLGLVSDAAAPGDDRQWLAAACLVACLCMFGVGTALGRSGW